MTLRTLSLVVLALGCGGSQQSEASTASAGSDAAQEGSKASKPMAKIVPAEKDEALKAINEFITSKNIDKSVQQWKTQLPRPPQVEFDESHEYFWLIDTNKGQVKLRFMPEVAPMHVSSTIFLTEVGFYDELVFHRVIPGFMAQGGCPVGSGGGNPGYSYGGEIDPEVRHDRPGLLSMANTGRPESDGSQFFLTFVPTPHLDGKHTVFGEVVEGMETLRELERLGSRGGQTSEPLLMKKATILVQQKPAPMTEKGASQG